MGSQIRTAAGRVRAYLQSFAGRDPDQIVAHVTTDFVNEHTAALGQGCVGRAAYRERLPAFLGDMLDLAYEIEDLVEQGDQVMVTYRMTARWKGETAISMRGAQHLVVRDGFIAHRTDYWDSAAFLLQVDPAAASALGRFGLDS